MLTRKEAESACLSKKRIKIFLKKFKVNNMEQKNEEKPVFIETYAEDMAKVIENDKGGGVIKKMIHAEEEHEIEKINQSPYTKRNKIFMYAGLIFMIIGSIALLYFTFKKKDAPTVPVAPQFMPLIFSDKNALVEVAGLTKDQIIKKVRSEIDGTSVKNGGVEGIYLTLNKSHVDLRQFIGMLNINFVPGSTDFVDDNFMMGVVNSATDPSSTSKDFFIIIKMRSAADVFDALHAWENKMFYDLHGFFGVDVTADTKYLLNANFTDGLVENKNARMLYDKNNNIVMMYIFADDNSVIITNTENAAHEIMLRLSASQIKK